MEDAKISHLALLRPVYKLVYTIRGILYILTISCPYILIDTRQMFIYNTTIDLSIDYRFIL